jgi:serine/threonine-protein kinase
VGDDTFAGRTLGGFRLIEERGRGAFATVYRARQVRLARDVAVKVLDPVLARNKDAARRFDREGTSAAGLDHENIVPVYEAGDEDGVVFLAMRYVSGQSFAEELAPARPTAERAVAVVRAVGRALDHAHSRGVLHRDVKPANILTEGERVWLADFGIAATVQQVGLYTSGAIGTMQYMAPEQAQPGEADGRSDLYSLGCVAYECVAGHPPFAAVEMAQLLFAHAHDEPPAVGDGKLDSFFARALAKAPGARFPTGDALASAFADALGVEEHAWDPLPVVRPRSRSRLVVALVAAVVLLAAATFALTRDEPTKYVAASVSLAGPAHVQDADGARYELPAGWKIAAINLSDAEHATVLREADHDAVLIVARAANGKSAARIAAETTDFPIFGDGTLPVCPPSNQHPTTLASVKAIRCQFKPTGIAASATNEVVVYYAVVGTKVWVLRQQPALDSAAVARFIDSLELR